MEFEEFDAHLARVRAEREGGALPEGLQLFEFQSASDAELLRVEQELAAQLPEKYKEFMRRYGGGQFLFVDLLPAISPEGRDDLLNVNQSEFTPKGFLAVAPVGTGDWWGFPTTDGICDDQVFFWDHEDGRMQVSHPDFLVFLTHNGLRVE
jgi:hypothetical protein